MEQTTPTPVTQDPADRIGAAIRMVMDRAVIPVDPDRDFDAHAECLRCGHHVHVRDECEWENGVSICDECAQALADLYRTDVPALCKALEEAVNLIEGISKYCTLEEALERKWAGECLTRIAAALQPPE